MSKKGGTKWLKQARKWSKTLVLTCNGRTAILLGGNSASDLYVECVEFCSSAGASQDTLPNAQATILSLEEFYRRAAALTACHPEDSNEQQLGDDMKVVVNNTLQIPFVEYMRNRAEDAGGAELVGHNLFVYWYDLRLSEPYEAYGTWMPASISGFDSGTGKHQVQYKAGNTDHLYLACCFVHFGGAPPAPGEAPVTAPPAARPLAEPVPHPQQNKSELAPDDVNDPGNGTASNLLTHARMGQSPAAGEPPGRSPSRLHEYPAAQTVLQGIACMQEDSTDEAVQIAPGEVVPARLHAEQTLPPAVNAALEQLQAVLQDGERGEAPVLAADPEQAATAGSLRVRSMDHSSSEDATSAGTQQDELLDAVQGQLQAGATRGTKRQSTDAASELEGSARSRGHMFVNRKTLATSHQPATTKPEVSSQMEVDLSSDREDAEIGLPRGTTIVGVSGAAIQAAAARAAQAAATASLHGSQHVAPQTSHPDTISAAPLDGRQAKGPTPQAKESLETHVRSSSPQGQPHPAILQPPKKRNRFMQQSSGQHTEETSPSELLKPFEVQGPLQFQAAMAIDMRARREQLLAAALAVVLYGGDLTIAGDLEALGLQTHVLEAGQLAVPQPNNLQEMVFINDGHELRLAASEEIPAAALRYVVDESGQAMLTMAQGPLPVPLRLAEEGGQHVLVAEHPVGQQFVIGAYNQMLGAAQQQQPTPAAAVEVGNAPAGIGTGARPMHEAGPRPVQEAGARSVQEAGPRPVGEAVPRAVQEAGPRPEQQAGPRPVREAGPRSVQEAGPRSVQEAGPRPVQEAVPRAVQEAGPRPEQQARPRPVREAGPRAVQEAGPRPVRASGPRAVQQAVPRVVQEAGPRPAQQAPAPHPPSLGHHDINPVNSLLSTASEGMYFSTVGVAGLQEDGGGALLNLQDMANGHPGLRQLNVGGSHIYVTNEQLAMWQAQMRLQQQLQLRQQLLLQAQRQSHQAPLTAACMIYPDARGGYTIGSEIIDLTGHEEVHEFPAQGGATLAEQRLQAELAMAQGRAQSAQQILGSTAMQMLPYEGALLAGGMERMAALGARRQGHLPNLGGLPGYMHNGTALTYEQCLQHVRHERLQQLLKRQRTEGPGQDTLGASLPQHEQTGRSINMQTAQRLQHEPPWIDSNAVRQQHESPSVAMPPPPAVPLPRAGDAAPAMEPAAGPERARSLPQLSNSENLRDIADGIFKVVNVLDPPKDIRKAVVSRLRSMNADDRVITYITLCDACRRQDFDEASEIIKDMAHT